MKRRIIALLAAFAMLAAMLPQYVPVTEAAEQAVPQAAVREEIPAARAEEGAAEAVPAEQGETAPTEPDRKDPAEDAARAEEAVLQEGGEGRTDRAPEGPALTQAEDASGQLTDTLSWRYEGYTLYIEGTGDMPDFNTSNQQAPWCDFRSNMLALSLPEGLTYIGAYAFYNCGNLRSLIMPDSLISIGDYAFSGCKMVYTIQFGSHLQSIGTCAFSNVGSYHYDTGNVVLPEGLISIGNSAFSNSGVETLTIPSSLTSIGESAFTSCRELRSVILSEGLRTIGSFMFSYCSELKSVELPDSLTTIPDHAFYSCGLTAVYLPEGLREIESSAFCGNNLETIRLPENLTTLGSFVFSDCTKLQSVNLPAGLTTVGDSLFSNCYGLKNVSLPENLTKISDNMFNGCSGLETLTLPDSLTTLGLGAFQNCTGLTSITLPDSLTTLGLGAFQNCTGLTSITLPEGLTDIPGNCFFGCTRLSEISLPESLTTIQGNAFVKCTALKELDLPAGLTTVGGNAFFNSGVDTVRVPELETWLRIKGAEHNYLLPNPGSLYVGGELLTEITIPETVTEISSYTFENVLNLTAVTVPESVIVIRANAFASCPNLQTVTVLGPDCIIESDAAALGTAGVTTVRGFTGSTAETYANTNGFAFESMGPAQDTAYVLGTTGTNGYWRLDLVTGVLDVYGQGFVSSTWGNYSSKITSAVFHEGVTELGHGLLESASNLRTVTLADSVIKLGEYVFTWCSSLEWVYIGAGLTDVPYSDYSAFGSVVSPENPNFTANEQGILFSKDGTVLYKVPKSLTGIYEIPAGVETIKNLAFYNTQLTEVRMPDSVKDIGSETFYGASRLSAVILGKSVPRIGYRAFYNNSSLTSIYIPVSVKVVEESAFFQCYSLATVYYQGSENAWNKIGINNSSGNNYNSYLTNALRHYGVEDVETHRYLMSTDAPTCTASGTATYGCDCGYSWTENVLALGHSWRTDQVVAPTCSADGYDVQVCVRCGATQNANINTDRPDHSYVDEVHAPTCVLAGYTVRTCANCGATVTTDFEPALGHEWDSGVVTVKPTYNTEGEQVFTCVRCGETRTEIIPACPEGRTVTVFFVDEIGLNTVNYYAFSADGGTVTASWPGAAAEYKGLDRYGHKVYAVTLDAVALDEVIFNNGSDWQTADLPFVTDAGVGSSIVYFGKPDEPTGKGDDVWKIAEEIAPTCTEPGKLILESFVTGQQTEEETDPATGHSWVLFHTEEPTCTEPGQEVYRCSVCNETKVELLEAPGHSWNEGAETTAPSCTEAGEKTFTCTVCGETRTEEIPAPGHSWNEGTETTAPSCTEPGEKTYTCTVCGETRTEELEALGHSWDEGAVNPAPTCTEAGEQVFTCTVCGETRTEVLEALGHSWDEGAETVAPTCTEAGEKTYTCTVCGETRTEVLEALGHSWDEGVVNTAPSCTDPGEMTLTCTVCGESTDVELPALGHDWQETSRTEPTCAQDGGIVYTCSRCQQTETETVPALGHIYRLIVTQAPTRQAAGSATAVCDRCSDVQIVSLPALNETDYELIPGDPTCTEADIDVFIWTHETYGELRFEAEAPALGHDYVGVVTEPTCTAEGFTTYTCSRCGDSYTAEPTPVQDHEYEEEVTAPTCVLGGYTTYTCVHCGASYVGDRTEALGHDYEGEVTEPTCTVGGYTTYTCSRCGKSYKGDPVRPTGHDFELTRVEPTCTSGGYDIRTCTRCDYSDHDNPTPALGHNYEGEITAPTCTEPGFTTFTCSRCGDSYTGESVPAMGHDYAPQTVAPTCTEGGYTVYTCTRCSDTYTDDPTPALDHAWDEGVVTVEPTETMPGQRRYTCVRCGEIRIENIPVLEHVHSYEAAVTAPTCTEMGYTTYTCACGDSYVDDYVGALGHDYVNGLCVRCGAKDPGFTAPQISMQTAFIRAGGEVTVAVNLEYNPGFAGLTLQILPGDGLTLTGIEGGSLLDPEQGECTVNPEEGLVNWTGRLNLYGDGELLLLTFRADETVAHGQQLPVSFALKEQNPVNFSDENGRPIAVDLREGFLTASTVLFGDTNSDEDITSADAVRLVRAIVKMVTLTQEQTWAGDVDHDDSITSADAVKLTRFLAGFPEDLNASRAATRRRGASPVTVAAAQVTCRPGQEIDVPVTVTGNPGFAGFTFSFAYDSSLELLGVSRGSLLNEGNGTFLANQDQCLVNWNSVSNLEGDGELFVLHFRTAEDAPDAVLPVTVSLKEGKPGNFVDENSEPIGVSFAEGSVTVAHEHVYEAQDPVAPTCTEDGYTPMVCAICGDTYRADVEEKLGHLAGQPEEKDRVEPTYLTEGGYDTVIFCQRCGIEMERTHTVLPRLEATLPCDGGEDCPGQVVFTDMPAKSHWAHDAIDWALMENITNGTGASVFSPSAVCTRAQVVTFLWRAAGTPEPETVETAFSDVPADAWYAEAVAWAVENGVTEGDGEGTFSPDRACTRAEVVTFLWRAAEMPEPETAETAFSDVPAGAWYAEAVAWAVGKGVTTGTGDTSFSPAKYCTRAQIVTFLYRSRND